LDSELASISAFEASVGTDEYPYRRQSPVIDVSDDFGPVRELYLWQLKGLRTEGLIAAAVLTFFFASINLAICPLIEVFDGSPGPPWYFLPFFVVFGAILAEGGLLCTCLVFLSGPFWLRFTVCWVTGLVLWACWASGLSFAGWRGLRDIEEILQVGSLSLPLVALAIQLPLWVARIYFGCRLTTQDQAIAIPPPLSIRDYFVGTAIVAISITSTRLARPSSWPIDEYWLGWAIVFCCFAGGGILGVLPALYFMFRWNRWWLGAGLLTLHAFVISSAILWFVDALDRGALGAFEMAAIMTMFLSLAAVLGLGMTIARGCGYALQTRRAAWAER
jgi:hypothetical protein